MKVQVRWRLFAQANQIQLHPQLDGMVLADERQFIACAYGPQHDHHPKICGNRHQIGNLPSCDIPNSIQIFQIPERIIGGVYLIRITKQQRQPDGRDTSVIYETVFAAGDCQVAIYLLNSSQSFIGASPARVDVGIFAHKNHLHTKSSYSLPVSILQSSMRKTWRDIQPLFSRLAICSSYFDPKRQHQQFCALAAN